MDDWKNEDEIKAELRLLTGELKRLREELRNTVTHPKPNPAREFLHRQAFPSGKSAEREAEAADGRKPRRSRKKHR